MRLISLPVSPFAARVRIAIYAKGLDIEIASPPEGWPNVVEGIGPIGRVPVLLCDVGIIPESQVILEYLEDRFPNATPLLPHRPKERARCRLVARVVDAYLMPPLVSLARPGGRGEHVHAAFKALRILDELLAESSLAVGSDLTFADCALPPALFAAGVTGERVGFNIFAGHQNLERYAAQIEQQRDVRRVLLEMREGLKDLEH